MLGAGCKDHAADHRIAEQLAFHLWVDPKPVDGAPFKALARAGLLGLGAAVNPVTSYALLWLPTWIRSGRELAAGVAKIAGAAVAQAMLSVVPIPAQDASTARAAGATKVKVTETE